MESFSIVHWIIVLAIIGVVVRPLIQGFKKGVAGDEGKMICPRCGTQGEPATITRGSIWIEIVLWLCLIVPGLIYSLWRISTRGDVCSACSQKGLIPVNSPNGKRLAKQFETS